MGTRPDDPILEGAGIEPLAPSQSSQAPDAASVSIAAADAASRQATGFSGALPSGFEAWLTQEIVDLRKGRISFSELWARFSAEGRKLLLEHYEKGFVTVDGQRYEYGGERLKQLGEQGLAFVKGTLDRLRKKEAEPAVEAKAAALAEVDEIDLFADLQPAVFTPESEEVMEELLHDIGRRLVGRKLTQKELASVRGSFRQAEKRQFRSAEELRRRQFAASLSNEAELDALAEEELLRIHEELQTQGLQEGAEVEGFDSLPTLEEIKERIRNSSDYQEALRLQKQPFTEFGAEEAALALDRDARLNLDPMEQAGVELRRTANAFVGALGRARGGAFG